MYAVSWEWNIEDFSEKYPNKRKNSIQISLNAQTVDKVHVIRRGFFFVKVS